MKRTKRILATATLSVAAMILSMATVGTASAGSAGSDRTSAATDASATSSDAANAVDEQTMGGGAGTLETGLMPSPRLAAAPLNTAGGNMFDTCDTPSLDSMRAWMASPYRTVGIYTGGIARACKTQKNLTPSWVATVTGMGWSLVPIYVGLQANCMTYRKGGKIIPFPSRMSASEAEAASQGRDAALDAIVQQRALGIGPNVPIYYDMEHYNASNGTCAAAVHAFTNAWTATLHSKGYLSGLYGSSSSMIHHAVAWSAKGNYARPDKLWFARWNGKADAEDPVIPAGAWAGNRIHQFAGGHKETWGGVTINIDSNFVQSFSTMPSFVQPVKPRVIWDSKKPTVGTKPMGLAVAGKGGIPTNASAAVLSIRVLNSTADGDLIVEAYRGNAKLATQQFVKGGSVSITTVVPVSSGAIQFRTTAGTARVIVSAVGYLTSSGADGIDALSPQTIWDSRSAKVGRTPTSLAVAGVGGVPSDATAAVLTVQVVSPTASGQLLVEPHGDSTNVGVQQFTKGRSISATVVVPLRDGAVQFRLSAGEARLIVATQGYLSPTAAGRLTATNPKLIWDTRTARITPSATAFAVAGRNEIPTDATAVLLNVEVVNPAAAGQLLVEPYGTRSSVGLQQFAKGQSISTTVLVPLYNRAAQVRVSAGKARVIITSLGYVTPAPIVPPDDGSGDTGDDGSGDSVDGG